MSTITPTIDSSRTIVVLPEEGLLIPISERHPETDALINISASNLIFKISGGFSKALVADPNNSLGRRVLVTMLELESPNAMPQGSGPRDWVIVDNGGEVPVVIAHGKIERGIPTWTV